MLFTIDQLMILCYDRDTKKFKFIKQTTLL